MQLEISTRESWENEPLPVFSKLRRFLQVVALRWRDVPHSRIDQFWTASMVEGKNHHSRAIVGSGFSIQRQKVLGPFLSEPACDVDLEGCKNAKNEGGVIRKYKQQSLASTVFL